ncbi:hypothetical protein ShirakiTB12_54610 [Priestia megaterium]|uniref:Uncharacterized protein n=1 Tax=Priestia megaterium TaxID=1404 RepID=A0AAX6BT93_PRIMG|nr:hypothetical protein ShirakiTB12_54610 [Priestia megaterium]
MYYVLRISSYGIRIPYQPYYRFGFSPQMFLLFQVALTGSGFTRTYETSYDTYLRPTLPNDST